MRDDDATRAAIRTADIILIAAGPNELAIFEGRPRRTVRLLSTGGELGQLWHDNFDAILTETQTLRKGQPTAIRLVNAANLWVIVPAANEGMADNFVTTGVVDPKSVPGADELHESSRRSRPPSRAGSAASARSPDRQLGPLVVGEVLHRHLAEDDSARSEVRHLPVANRREWGR